MITYRLESTGMCHTPGIVRWAINGYHFPKDRKAMLAIFTEGYGLPRHAAVALLSKAVPFTLDGDTVVLTVADPDQPVVALTPQEA